MAATAGGEAAAGGGDVDSALPTNVPENLTQEGKNKKRSRVQQGSNTRNQERACSFSGYTAQEFQLMPVTSTLLFGWGNALGSWVQRL